MRRVLLPEVSRVTGLSVRRLRQLCAEGHFPSARKDQPRDGWSLAECCLAAERASELCGVCEGEERVTASPLRWRIDPLEDGARLIVDGTSSEPVSPEQVGTVLHHVAAMLEATARELRGRAGEGL